LRDGILLVNKPVGMTSHDVIDYIKEKLNIKKIGHCGTLDPFASGLLIILINNATKLQQLFLKENKEYEGTFIFGKKYDTLDITGNLIEEKDFELTLKDVKKYIEKFPSEYMQTPPQFSAVKVNGRKGYEYARANKEVKLTPRKVSIYNLLITNRLTKDEFRFMTKVSSGTYIRKLAEDIATSFGSIASLSSLNRISSGRFHLKEAINLADITKNNIISTYDFFKNYPKLEVSDYIKHLVINGIYLDERQIKIDEDFIAVDQDGEMLAYYLNTGNYKYKPIYFFKTKEERDREKIEEGEYI